MSDVLGIAPHPDDLELSAGGTIAGLVKAGHTVRFLDLTRGERASRGTPETREEEARQAALALGLSGRENLGLPDCGVSSTDPGHVLAVVEHIREHRPRLIVSMHENDDHTDHQEGAALVRRAVYLAGLRNWPRENHEPHRVERCIFAMGRRSFEPRFIVDVTSTYEEKRQALAAFHSQFHRDLSDPNRTPISEPGFLKAVEGRDRYFGSMIGAEFGEAFWTDRPWPMAFAGLLS